MARFYIIAIFMLILSCNSHKEKPDVSHIKVAVSIDRFEADFFNLDTTRMEAALAGLQKKYPLFYPIFTENIMGVNPADAQGVQMLKNIISGYYPIYDTIKEKYNNLGWLKEEMENSFRFVKFYYPAYRLPRLITYVGTFDAPGIILTPDYLGIGLHQYAGKNFSVYQSEPIQQLYPTYLSRRFDKEYMVANAIKAVADDLYPDASVGKPLVEQMIEKGKHWFLTDKFLPDAPDSVKTGYTGAQLKWLAENEGNVWAYLIKNENIYSIEPPVIQAYLGEAPFTQGMPEASPGNIGQWIGWQMVEKFAAENKEMSVQQILQASPKTILDGAQYRPK